MVAVAVALAVTDASAEALAEGLGLAPLSGAAGVTAITLTVGGRMTRNAPSEPVMAVVRPPGENTRNAWAPELMA